MLHAKIFGVWILAATAFADWYRRFEANKLRPLALYHRLSGSVTKIGYGLGPTRIQGHFRDNGTLRPGWRDDELAWQQHRTSGL